MSFSMFINIKLQNEMGETKLMTYECHICFSQRGHIHASDGNLHRGHTEDLHTKSVL